MAETRRRSSRHARGKTDNACVPVAHTPRVGETGGYGLRLNRPYALLKRNPATAGFFYAQATASEFVFEAGADVARVAVAVLVEAELVAVFFVEEVIDVDLRGEVVGDLVAPHQVDHGVAVLAVVHVGAGGRVFGLGPGAALPGDTAADGQAADGRHVVGGEQFELFARVGGVQLFAFGVFAAPLGIARTETQVFGRVAARFEFEAADFRAFGGVVGGRRRVGAGDGFAAALREVVLAGAVGAGLGVQAAIEPVGFPPQFPGAAADGVKQVVVAVALGLGFVDVGVAGVHGLVRGDVVGDACVRCPDGAVFLAEGFLAAFARAFPVADAGADDGGKLGGVLKCMLPQTNP